MNVGYNGSATYARVTSDIKPNTGSVVGFVTVDFKLITPGDAVAGTRNFYIRVSYSFT
jgi:hypothetical protein